MTTVSFNISHGFLNCIPSLLNDEHDYIQKSYFPTSLNLTPSSYYI